MRKVCCSLAGTGPLLYTSYPRLLSGTILYSSKTGSPGGCGVGKDYVGDWRRFRHREFIGPKLIREVLLSHSIEILAMLRLSSDFGAVFVW